MSKPKKSSNLSKQPDSVGHHKIPEHVVTPTLYSSIIQTESKLRNISLSHLEPKPITKKAGNKELNFPLNGKMFDYRKMVDVGLNSGTKVETKYKPKPKQVYSKKKPEPKLSNYYQPNFENPQRIQMDSVKTATELTLQYDGLAVSRLLNEIDDLIMK